jgi:hypothetical protein
VGRFHWSDEEKDFTFLLRFFRARPSSSMRAQRLWGNRLTGDSAGGLASREPSINKENLMRVHALLRAKPIAQRPVCLVVDDESLPGVDHLQLRMMLQEAGLKTSMPRLKVLEMLCLASLQGGGISSRHLHERLVEAGEPLSLVSVRQVLGRMVESGLVVAQGGSRFCLAPAWEATISPQRPRNSSAA